MPIPDEPGKPAHKASRVWWWIVAAFVLQISVWTAWLIFAARHKVEEVPLVTVGAP